MSPPHPQWRTLSVVDLFRRKKLRSDTFWTTLVCVFMYIIRHNLNVSRNVFVCLFFMSGQLKQIHFWEWKCFAVILRVGGWECLYKMGLYVSTRNCRDDENIFLYPCRKKFHIHHTRHKGCTNSNCLYTRIYLIWHPQDWRGAGLLNFPFVFIQ